MTCAAFTHFAKRVEERLPNAGVPAKQLWDGIIADIESGAPKVLSFEGRLKNKNRRAWRVRYPRVEHVFFVYDHADRMPITVITDAFLKYSKSMGYHFFQGDPKQAREVAE